jgi:hypothetical protein
MVIETQIFENIISVEEQDIVFDFMETDYENWVFSSYISSKMVNPKSNIKFPGYSCNINKEKKYDKILPIIKKIETNTCKKTGFKFLQNDRYKLNCFPPINGYNLDELYRNIHYDMLNEHIVLLYYVNDSDGDTLLFKNKRGYDSSSNTKTMIEANNGIFDNIELIETITPKKGSVSVFDGKLLHCAGWSKTHNRYNVNFNISIDNNQKKINLI